MLWMRDKIRIIAIAACLIGILILAAVSMRAGVSRLQTCHDEWSLQIWDIDPIDAGELFYTIRKPLRGDVHVLYASFDAYGSTSARTQVNFDRLRESMSITLNDQNAAGEWYDISEAQIDDYNEWQPIYVFGPFSDTLTDALRLTVTVRASAFNNRVQLALARSTAELKDETVTRAIDRVQMRSLHIAIASLSLVALLLTLWHVVVQRTASP